MRKSVGSPQQRRLSGLLRDLRLEAGLTQVEMAERLDVAQSFVSNYEAGQRRMDLIELEQIGEVLGVSLAEIVTAYQRGRRR